MTTNAIPESDILAPRDPRLDKNSDDWPEFELKDVRVYTPDNPSELISLLDAAAHHPVTLAGHLEPLPKDQVHLQIQSTTRRSPLIEITDVRTFSYGQFEDGNIGLWAGGAAGWFALKPARAYKSIWNSMVESVNTFYWIADAYREKRRKGTKKTSPLLPDYTVEELFDNYADKVLEDAHGGKEAAQVIEDQRYFLLASMLAGKEGIIWTKNPLYLHLSQRFPEEHALLKMRLTGQGLPSRNARHTSVKSENSNLKRKRGRPAKDRSRGEAVSTREESLADSASAEPRSKREASQQHLAKSTSLRGIRRGKTESAGPDSSEAEAKTPRAVVDSDDEHMQKSMKGRSALRPKASKAGKGASKGGKAPVLDFCNDSDDDDNQQSPVASRRRHSHNTGHRHQRRRSSKHDVDEGIDIPSSPTSGDPPSTPSDTGAGAAEDGSDDEEAPGTDLAVRLKHEADPIQEDTWVCALDGCTHKVYQASQVDSQRLIREHYALHAYDDDARVKLVKKLQHPSLPVGHLMERVRLQARTDGFPNSRPAPEGANAHSRYRPLPQVRY